MRSLTSDYGSFCGGWGLFSLSLPSFPPPPCIGANSPATTIAALQSPSSSSPQGSAAAAVALIFCMRSELCCVVVVAAVAPFDLIVEPETFVKSPMGNAWASRGGKSEGKERRGRGSVSGVTVGAAVAAMLRWGRNDHDRRV